MNHKVQAALGALLFCSIGCYHATIETGLTPSPQTIEQPFAASFIGGLVPPSTVETASKCPNGVAKVETQLSFLNWVVSAVTLSIFTPMDIKVTCAAGAGSSGAAGVEGDAIHADVPSGASAREALELAAALGWKEGRPVIVQLPLR